MRLSSLVSPWKSGSSLQCGTVLISVTFPWLSKTLVASGIARRQSVQLRASNSRAMRYEPTPRQSVPTFGAYSRNKGWSSRDRRVRPGVRLSAQHESKVP